ncbi:hypothetical protein ACMG4P_14250 [Pseudovibrio denitrificans]|uniref:hypothetical protein n=1 Tax=Pseudovibrio denitrificans TaxID=258256 RepID=UPI0039BF0429
MNQSSKSDRTSAFRQYLILVLLLAILVILANGLWRYVRANSVPEQITFGAHFDANETYFAFFHVVSETEYGVVLYNAETDETKLFTSSEKVLRSPRFSPNTAQIYLSADPLLNTDTTSSDANTGTFTSNLYKCNIANDSCDRQFDFLGSIRDTAELSDGNILFSGARTSNVADPWTPENIVVDYRNSDFYLFDQNTRAIEKLTNLHAVGLRPISVAERLVAFQLLPTPQMRNKYGHVNNSIYLASLNTDDQFIDLPKAITKPFVSYGTSFNGRPSLSPDGRHLAFVAATSRPEAGGYVYVFAVADVLTKSVVEVIAPMKTANANTLSMPIFIDNTTIRYMQLAGREYSFWQYSLLNGEAELIRRLKLSDIAMAERVEISMAW